MTLIPRQMKHPHSGDSHPECEGCKDTGCLPVAGEAVKCRHPKITAKQLRTCDGGLKQLRKARAAPAVNKKTK